MRFEVKTELSKEDFRSYYRLNQKVHARFAYILGRVLGVAAVVMLIVRAIENKRRKKLNEES